MVLGLLSLTAFVELTDLQINSFSFRKVPVPEFCSLCFDIVSYLWHLFFSSHIQYVVVLT